MHSYCQKDRTPFYEKFIVLMVPCNINGPHITPLLPCAGDLMDEANVLEFLTSLEAMELPDQIEEVNAKILDKVVEEQEFVAVLFCKALFCSYLIFLPICTFFYCFHCIFAVLNFKAHDMKSSISFLDR